MKRTKLDIALAIAIVIALIFMWWVLVWMYRSVYGLETIF